VAHDLGPTLRVISVYPGEDLVVGQDVLLLDSDALGGPRPKDLVVCLVVGNGDGIVHDVANCVQFRVQGGQLLAGRVYELLLGLLERGLLLEELVCILLILPRGRSAAVAPQRVG